MTTQPKKSNWKHNPSRARRRADDDVVSTTSDDRYVGVREFFIGLDRVRLEIKNDFNAVGDKIDNNHKELNKKFDKFFKWFIFPYYLMWLVFFGSIVLEIFGINVVSRFIGN